LKQSGTLEDFIAGFEFLAFCTKGMFDVFSENALLVASRMKSMPNVLMALPQSWVEATKRAKEAQKVLFSNHKTILYSPP
jgi:hypothetical protein